MIVFSRRTNHADTQTQSPGIGFQLLRRAVMYVAAAVAFVALTAGLAGYLVWNDPSRLTLFSTLFAEAGIRTESGISYGNLPRQKLDVYYADKANESAPIALFIYGGSWTQGDRSIYGFVGSALAARGITTVIPDYRLYPEVQFPAFVDDVAEAYAWVSKNLSSKCLPERPIVLVGHSAGAHMAALLALDKSYLNKWAPGRPRPAAFIGLAGPYTFYPTQWPSTAAAFASVAATPDVPRPITYVSPGAPPSLLLHGLSDDLVNVKNARELDKALTAAGNRVRRVELPGLGHIGILLAIAQPLRWRGPVLDEVSAFINQEGGSQPACSPRD